MTDADHVLDFLIDAGARGVPAALVTLTDVTGGSARGPGAMMAVDADGGWTGSFSGGCVEAAVVAEAQAAIAEGRPRLVRFGAGSPYLDIRLPCGGGIDLLFVPAPAAAAVAAARALAAQRRSATLVIAADGGIEAAPSMDADRTGWAGKAFRIRIDPPLKLIVAGHGAEPGALLRLARGYGADAHLLSPDAGCVADAGALGYPADRLVTVGRTAHLGADPHAAIVLLFHDHEWEDALLMQALESDAFFIGAMGSAQTHAARLGRLAQAGVPAEALARIVGPIGLIKATRDPATLAISILAQVVQARDARACRSEKAILPVASP